jgi:hypothetical protein
MTPEFIVEATQASKTTNQDRRCPTRTLSRMIDTPVSHHDCHTNRRGSHPQHQG